MADPLRPTPGLDPAARRFGFVAAVVALLAPILLLAAGFRPHMPELQLLASAPPAVRLHLLGVGGAALIGLVLLSGVKGTTLHKRLGWAWVVLMLFGAAASLFVEAPGMQQIGFRLGPFGPLHLLSLWVLVALPWAIVSVRRGDVARHGRLMTGVFFGGLLIAGAFTLIPGRLMWQVFFG